MEGAAAGAPGRERRRSRSTERRRSQDPERRRSSQDEQELRRAGSGGGRLISERSRERMRARSRTRSPPPPPPLAAVSQANLKQLFVGYDDIVKLAEVESLLQGELRVGALRTCDQACLPRGPVLPRPAADRRRPRSHPGAEHNRRHPDDAPLSAIKGLFVRYRLNDYHIGAVVRCGGRPHRGCSAASQQSGQGAGQLAPTCSLALGCCVRPPCRFSVNEKGEAMLTVQVRAPAPAGR